MKVQITGYVHWVKFDYEDKPEWEIYAHEMSTVGPEYVLVGEQVFEVDIPDDFDPRPQQIESLRNKKKEILATAEMQANNIEEQIQKLLCLEYKAD